METILASIRRIIREDEGGGAPEPTLAGALDEDEEDDLLVLQPAMMVKPITAEEAAVSADAPLAGPSRDAAALAAALFDDEPMPPAAAPPAPLVTAIVVPAAPPPPAPAPPPSPPVLPAADAVPDAMLLKPTYSLTSMTEEPLLAPQAHAAAALALATLQEAVRPSAPPGDMRLLRSGGPTIEDLVRDELRGQLKLWLDVNLPPMVERLVRQEIERLVRPV